MKPVEDHVKFIKTLMRFIIVLLGAGASVAAIVRYLL